MKFSIKYIFSFCLLIAFYSSSVAQVSRQVIQFSGFIIGEDENPLIGVHVYIPKAGRGTATNNVGFFSVPTVTGDSVVISAVGYKKRYIRIPNNLTESAYSVVIELKEDFAQLPMVEVYPYPTEELFKQAFLALELPDEKEQKAIQRNLDQDMLNRMMYENPTVEPGAAFRYSMNQQAYYAANRNFFPTNPLLNPFAWANFIKSIKRGDLKKKKWKE